ncbi:MAG: alpha/beta fold hydrolase [Pseudorhodoplanes sp.]
MPETGTISHVVGSARERGTTSYRRSGSGSTIILLHGLGMQNTVWQPQIEILNKDFDVVTFDMLGHGLSSLPPEKPQLSDYADQVLSVMDALGIASAHIAGHSMGALIGLEFALTHPERVRSVAPMNGVYCRPPHLQQTAEARARELEASGGMTPPDETLKRWFGHPIPPELTVPAEICRSFLTSVNPVGYMRTYRLFVENDRRHEGRLETLAVPALFMTSENDPHSTPDMSRAMAAAAPDSRCIILPRERHMMTLTAPAEVTRHLISFVREVEARASREPLMTETVT